MICLFCEGFPCREGSALICFNGVLYSRVHYTVYIRSRRDNLNLTVGLNNLVFPKLEIQHLR